MTRYRFFTRAGWIGIIAAILAYGALLMWKMGAYAGGSDSSGYLNCARLLRDGKIRMASRTLRDAPADKLSAYAYIPLGFSPCEPGCMVPNYPIGLPLLVVASSWLVGWDAASHVTMWMHAMAGVALMFALARQAGIPVPLASLGAIMLAASPLYLFVSLQLLSDMPALVWTTAAVLLAWRGGDRGQTVPAFFAGIAFAVAVLIRPTNVLAFFPVAIALGRGGWRWLAFIGGGLPGAIALAAFNRAAYGSVLASGYGPIWNAFRIELGPVTLMHYLHWLPVLLTPLIVLAFGLPSLARNDPRRVAILGSWIIGFAGFYLFYPFTSQTWWFLRFLLPAFPAIIVAMLLVLKQLTQRFSRLQARSGVILAATLGAVVLWAGPWSWKLHSLTTGDHELVYREAASWAKDHVPRNAVVFSMQSTGALLYYTDFTFVYWPLVTSADIAKVEFAAAAENRPIIAMLFPFEEKDLLREKLPGRWTRIGSVKHVSFWRREGS